MKVGDLVQARTTSALYSHGIGVVTKVRRGTLSQGFPVYVTAVWMDWRGERCIEQQYLEVISENR
jgi:hypothetical protein